MCVHHFKFSVQKQSIHSVKLLDALSLHCAVYGIEWKSIAAQQQQHKIYEFGKAIAKTEEKNDSNNKEDCRRTKETSRYNKNRNNIKKKCTHSEWRARSSTERYRKSERTVCPGFSTNDSLLVYGVTFHYEISWELESSPAQRRRHDDDIHRKAAKEKAQTITAEHQNRCSCQSPFRLSMIQYSCSLFDVQCLCMQWWMMQQLHAAEN